MPLPERVMVAGTAGKAWVPQESKVVMDYRSWKPLALASVIQFRAVSAESYPRRAWGPGFPLGGGGKRENPWPCCNPRRGKG